MMRFRADEDNSAGFTLVELMVASALLAVVLFIAGSITVVTIRNQRTVSSVTAAANSTQVSITQIANAIRDSSAFRVDTVNTTDQLVQARVAVGDTGGVTNWACRAWYFDRTRGQIRYTSSTVAASPTAITSPTTTTVTTWQLFATGVQPQAGASGSMFAISGHALTINLSAAISKSPSLSIATTAVSRSENWTGSTCFTAP